MTFILGDSSRSDDFSMRTEAERMLLGYAEAIHTDTGASASSICKFADPSYVVNHSFYLLVVPMLSRCFPRVDSTKVWELGRAFYGIFRMVLAMDRVTDRQESGFLFDGLVHYTVAIRRLSAVFPADSVVWSGLTNRICQSIAQINLERELRNCDERDLVRFVSVAEGKSTLIQLPVDWLDAIQPVGDLADRLRNSLLYKHLGMQWLDDINDFAVDADQGQPTWARARLAAYASTHSLDLASLSPAKQKRLMFACGLGEELLDEARGYFVAALAELGDLDVPEYANVIKSYIAQIHAIGSSLAEEREAASSRLTERKFLAKTQL